MLIHPLTPLSASPLTPVVFMPGLNGDGAATLARVKRVAEALLTFPTLLVFPEVGTAESPEVWAATLAKAAQDHTLTDRGLVFGHNHGADQACQFTLDHPGDVAACVALSAEVWADPTVEDPQRLSETAWMIGCGESDTAERIRAAQAFQVGLAERGCRVDLLDWEGGHDELPHHTLENAMYFFNETQNALHRSAA
ncbi:MAG: hypothetical protein AAGH99_02220 [Planctomycetota bacterium]